jgi:hypothetical protein
MIRLRGNRDVNAAFNGRGSTPLTGRRAPYQDLSQPVVAYNVPLAATQPDLRVIVCGGVNRPLCFTNFGCSSDNDFSGYFDRIRSFPR